MFDYLKKPHIKRHMVNFSRFTLIGVIASLLNIFLVWLFLDIIGIKTFIGTSLAVFCVFIVKFYLYLTIKLITSQFIKYTIIQVSSSLANIFLTWLLIDIFFVSTLIATILVVGGLFIGRYIVFNLLKLIPSK